MTYRKQLRKLVPDWDSIRDHLHRYYGIKTMVLAMLTLFFTTIIVTASILNIVPSFTFLFSEIWWHFVYLYWRTHIGLLILFLILFGLVLWFNVFQNSVGRVFPMPPLFSGEEDRVKRLFRRVSRALSVVFAVEFIIAIPVLHLWSLTWSRPMTIAATCLSVLAPVLSSYFVKKKYLKSLAGYTFANTTSFNTAAKGTQAYEVLQELTHFATLREPNPISPGVSSFIARGDGYALWKGYRRLYESLGEFVNVPSGWITTHHSATDAFAYALKLVLQDDAHIMFSDLEYHSMKSKIGDAISEDERPNRIHEIKLQEEHLRGKLDAPAIEDRFIDEVCKHLQKIKVERTIILVSHVVYLTGIVLDVKRIHDEILRRVHADGRDRVVFIIDGAQALGNIAVERQVIDCSDFYISSGHKWLLTTGTLGLLIHDSSGKKQRLNTGHMYEGLRPFAHADFRADDHTLTETVDLDPLISLNGMLAEFNRLKQKSIAEHNRALATLFNQLTFNIPGISVLSTPVQSGIVSIKLTGSNTDVFSLAQILESEFGIVGQAFPDSILRFSFHYYMGQREIYDLADALYKAMRMLQPGAKHYLT